MVNCLFGPRTPYSVQWMNYSSAHLGIPQPPRCNSDYEILVLTESYDSVGIDARDLTGFAPYRILSHCTP